MVGMTGAVTYCFFMDGRRCDDDDMSLLSLARARRSLSSSSDISELESSDSESDSEELSSALGNAPGTLYARADICRVDEVRPSDVGNCWPADALVALKGVATRAEYAR